METELILSKGGLPPFSARGCTQTLSSVNLGAFQRTITNKLVYLGKCEKKFKSTIRCQDLSCLATDDLSPGAVVEVGCIQRLWQKIIGAHCFLERPALEGSLFVVDENQQPLENYTYENQTLHFKNSEKGFISYRPLLTMQVKDYILTTDEWGLKVGWQLDLEEI